MLNKFNYVKKIYLVAIFKKNFFYCRTLIKITSIKKKNKKSSSWLKMT